MRANAVEAALDYTGVAPPIRRRRLHLISRMRTHYHQLPNTEVHPELINSRFAYVSVSRASHDAQIYTNNAASLAQRLSRDVTKTSAINFGQAQGSPAQVGIALGIR